VLHCKPFAYIKPSLRLGTQALISNGTLSNKEVMLAKQSPRGWGEGKERPQAKTTMCKTNQDLSKNRNL
jgi:hypothetical protein